MRKLLLLIAFTCSVCYTYAFKAVLHISTTPSDAKIYIDNEYKGEGNIIITLNQAKIVQVKVEKEGYTTQNLTYAYDVKDPKDARKSYDRGENKIVIELEKKAESVIGKSSKGESAPTSETRINDSYALGKAIMVDDKYVFVNCEPVTPYEKVFEFETSVIVAGGFKSPTVMDMIIASVKNAKRNGIPFDAIIANTSGKVDVAIRFKK